MARTYITFSLGIQRFLTSESERVGRSVNDLVRQYITDRKEFQTFAINATTISEAFEAGGSQTQVHNNVRAAFDIAMERDAIRQKELRMVELGYRELIGRINPLVLALHEDGNPVPRLEAIRDLLEVEIKELDPELDRDKIEVREYYLTQICQRITQARG